MRRPVIVRSRGGMTVRGRIARLLAILVAVGACRDDARVPITAPPPAGPVDAVSITATQQSLAPGDSVRYTAQALDAQGRVLPTATIAWSSSAVTIATVNASGVVTGVAPGEATITASSEGRTASVTVSVSVAQLCECLRIIDSTSISLVERDDSTGVYRLRVVRGAPPAIDSGSIIVGAEDGGYLRRVQRVIQNGSQLILETSQAYLDDVVQEGEFGITSPGDGETIEDGSTSTRWGEWTTTYVAPEITTSAATRGSSLAGLGFRIDVSPTPQTPIRVDFTVKDGNFYMPFPLDIGAKWKFFQLQNFRAIVRAQAEVDIREYEMKVSGVITTKNLKLATESKRFLVKQRPFVTFIGPMPLVGIMTATFKLQVTPIVSAGVVFTGDFKTGFKLESGMRWSRSSGWKPVATATRIPPQASAPELKELQGTASVKIALVPELSIQLYGVVGPFINLEPYAEAAATAELAFTDGDVSGMDWETLVRLGLNLNVGAKFTLLGRKDLAEAKFIIPLVKPYVLTRAFSDGPLTVFARVSGPDAPPEFGVRLRPSFADVAPPGGRSIATSFAESPVTAGDSVTFDDVRSGRDYPHTIEATSVPGNCSASATRGTLDVASYAYLALGGIPASDTISLSCIPLGALNVRVLTSGADPVLRSSLTIARRDSVGIGKGTTPFTVELPGGAGQRDSIIAGLVPANPASGANGLYRITLEPERRNCAVAAPSAHEAAITSGDTSQTDFRVTCVALGHARIQTQTVDPDPAPGSPGLVYAVRVVPSDPRDGANRPPVQIGAAATTVVNDLIPLYNASQASGKHTVVLSNVANRCMAQAGAQRAVTVFPGDTTYADFNLSCVERFHIHTRASGPSADPDGYSAVINNTDGTADTVAVPVSGSVAVRAVAPGSHLVELVGVDGGCVTPPAVTQTVGAFDSTSVTFQVECPGPASPSGLKTTLVEPTRIDLEWVAPSAGPRVASYRLFRSTTGTPRVTTTIDSVFPRSHVDIGLPQFTLFEYRVAAVDSNGVQGVSSAPLRVRTRDASPPVGPTDLAAVLQGTSTAVLTWSAASDPQSGIVRYRIYRDGASIATTTSTAFQNNGLAGYRTYSYQVVAENGDSQVGALSNAVSVSTPDITPPSSPGTLVGTAVGLRVDLTWGAATDGETGIVRYRVYRSGLLIDSTASLTYSDATVVGGTTHIYAVRAVNGAGLQGASSNSVTVVIPDITPPSQPMSLVAVPTDATSITLSWAPASDPETGISRYFLYRDNVRVATVPGVAFIDTGLTAGTTYSYEVSAENGAGAEGPRSVAVQATTPNPPATGDLQVRTTTTGTGLPLTSYVVRVSAGPVVLTQPAGTNDTLVFASLAPQTWTIELQNIPANCKLDEGSNPRQRVVTAQALVSTLFEVSCQ